MSKQKTSLSDIPEEELAKVDRLKNGSKSPKVDPEWMIISEFGYYFGYPGVKAILSNEITTAEMMQLILGSRKLYNIMILDHANAARAAEASLKTKNPNKTYKEMLKEYIAGAKNE